MNRTGIIVAITATTLLGVGGWYTRSWWWGSKPTAAKASEKAEKEKTTITPAASASKRTVGESEPAEARVASAQIHNRFNGRPAAKSRFGGDEPLSSDEPETGGEEEKAPVRPGRFEAKFTKGSEEETAAGDATTTDAPADKAEPSESTEPSTDAATAGTGNEAATEEATTNAGEEEVKAPADKEGAAPVEAAPEVVEREPVIAKPMAPRRLDTSRAPPLRSEEEETAKEAEAEPEKNVAARETPPEEVMRIQEPTRAARALPKHLEAPAESEAESAIDTGTIAKKSLKVAQPLTRPPQMDEPGQGGAGATRSIDESGAELTNVISRGLSKPEESPGDRRLEGEQSAPLTLTKIAPSEVSVGRPATFETRVRNSGSSVAHQVIVMDRVPRGARLIDATPKYTQTAEGHLIWDLGSLDPGQEALIKMQLMPEEEGEIGSVASASYQVKASSRTVSTRPQLDVEHTGPAKVLVGEQVTFSIRVHNPGTGVARGVRIEEDVPRGLSHPDGRQLEHEIGDLKPGETRILELELTAAEAGGVSNLIRVRGEGDLQAEHKIELEVLAPQIVTEISGPKRRYLDRQATYNLRISNPGTAAAKMVEFSAQLPTGFKYVSADNSGKYDARKHAVYWKIESLPAGQEGIVQLVLLSTTSGQQTLRAAARTESGLESAYELPIVIEAAPETTFTVRDSSDPIEVGADSVYEIVVSNRGTRADSQVRISATLPAEMKILDAQGPTAHVIDGQQVVFEPLGKLDPKSEVTYKIKIRALSASADPRVVKVQAMSAALTTPVSREESTLIYEDR